MLSSRPVDFNNGGVFFPTKTPARGIKNRLENQSVGGPTMSAKGGKMAGGMPKTPFHGGSNQKTILYTISRPLGDKTPAANRLNPILFQTPAGGKTGGQKSKLSKLVLETNNDNTEGNDQQERDSPPSSQRPSSQRRNIKQPKQLNLNGLIGKLDTFQTPMNKGHHWDIDDEDMVNLEGQGLMQEAIMEEVVAEENSSDDEVEFGHPNNLDLPYQPPFDFELPNFEVLGKTIRSLAFGPLIVDSEKPVFVDPQIQNDDLVWGGVQLDLGPLESDDPFEEARKERKPVATKVTAPASKPRLMSSKATSVKPTPSLVAAPRPRPASSLARISSQPASKPPTTTSTRPTTTSTLKPAATRTAVSSNSSTTTTRKIVTKPAIPSNVAPRPIVRSTSTTSTGPAPSVVRQNLASMRRAQTAMSVRDARSGVATKVSSAAVKGVSGIKSVKTTQSVASVDGDGLGGMKLNLNVDGEGLDEEFLFSVN